MWKTVTLNLCLHVNREGSLLKHIVGQQTMMLCMSVKSHPSGHWMLPSQDYTSEHKVERTMLWWWLDWPMAWASLSMTPKLLVLLSSFAFPNASYLLAIPIWANVLGQRFADTLVRCAVSGMRKTHLLEVQIPLHAYQRSLHSWLGYNLSTLHF